MLGCTHYPLLAGVLQIVLGPDVTLVSSADETAKDLVRVLMDADLLRDPAGPPPGPHEFLATGDPEPFRRLGRRFLGPEIGSGAPAAPPVSRRLTATGGVGPAVASAVIGALVVVVLVGTGRARRLRRRA